MIRRLLPSPQIEINPLDFYVKLPRPTPKGRPWVLVNMVASADGATSVYGSSKGLSNSYDRVVFSAIRGCSDWVIAASGTVRAERYRLPKPSTTVRNIRVSSGLSEYPRLAVASSNLNLGLDLPMFADRQSSGEVPVIFTGSGTSTTAIETFADVAEIVAFDSPFPGPSEMLAELRIRGARVVLCEGGPSFNAQFVDAGLVDELCLSTTPLLAGGSSSRIVHKSRRTIPLPLKLDHLFEAEGTLFARYLTQHD